jgi:hypothetical protein
MICVDHNDVRQSIKRLEMLLIELKSAFFFELINFTGCHQRYCSKISSKLYSEHNVRSCSGNTDYREECQIREVCHLIQQKRVIGEVFATSQSVIYSHEK